MQSHSSGPILGSRNAASTVIQSFPVDFTRLNGVSFKLCTIAANALRSVGFIIRSANQVASDATTAVLDIGSQPNGNQFIAAANLKLAPGTTTGATYGSEVNIVSALTDIWATVNSTGTATVGRAWIMIEMFDLNPEQPSGQD